MNKNKLQEVAQKLMLKVDAKVLDQLSSEYDQLLTRIKMMQKIDVANIEPMVRPDEALTTYLRTDKVSHTLDKDVVMKNATYKHQGYIAIKRVLDND